jgi:hypothetical protein
MAQIKFRENRLAGAGFLRVLKQKDAHTYVTKLTVAFSQLPCKRTLKLALRLT